MDKVRKQKYRKRLEQELLDLRALLLSQADSSGDDGDRATEDTVDQAAQSYAKEFLFRQSDAERAQLLQVEAAIARVESPEFGRCENCGERIGEKRLDAVPWARLCRDCQEAEERDESATE